MKFSSLFLIASFLLSTVFLFAEEQSTQTQTNTSGEEQSTQTQTNTSGAYAPADTRIPRNSRIYIAPMDGFETYLAAALRDKEVPLVVVIDRSQADFEITGTHEKKSSGWAKTIFMGDARSSASASMQVVNLKSKVVVYADSSHRGSANKGERSTAEKLAKYLKKKIEQDEKKK